MTYFDTKVYNPKNLNKANKKLFAERVYMREEIESIFDRYIGEYKESGTTLDKIRVDIIKEFKEEFSRQLDYDDVDWLVSVLDEQEEE